MSRWQVIMAVIAGVLALMLLYMAGAEILNTRLQGYVFTTALVVAVGIAIASVAGRFINGGAGFWAIALQRALWVGVILLLATLAWMIVTNLVGAQLGILAAFLVLLMLAALIVEPRAVASVAFPVLLILAALWLVPKIDFEGALQSAQQEVSEAVETPQSETEEQTEQSTSQAVLFDWTTQAREDGRPLVGVAGVFFLEGVPSKYASISEDEGRLFFATKPTVKFEDGQRGIAALQAGGRHPVGVPFHYDAEVGQFVPDSGSTTIALAEIGDDSFDLNDQAALFSGCTSPECAAMMGQVWSIIKQGDPMVVVECGDGQSVKGDWLLTVDSGGAIGSLPFKPTDQIGRKCTVSGLGTIFVMDNGQIVTDKPLRGD